MQWKILMKRRIKREEEYMWGKQFKLLIIVNTNLKNESLTI